MNGSGRINPTFETSEAIPQYARVKIASTGLIAKAAIGDRHIGVALREAFASGDEIAVELVTEKVVMATDITIGSLVHTAAAGKGSKTAGTGSFQMGIALQAAAADGDVIEIAPLRYGAAAS